MERDGVGCLFDCTPISLIHSRICDLALSSLEGAQRLRRQKKFSRKLSEGRNLRTPRCRRPGRHHRPGIPDQEGQRAKDIIDSADAFLEGVEAHGADTMWG
jgi:hypothetical protein